MEELCGPNLLHVSARLLAVRVPPERSLKRTLDRIVSLRSTGLRSLRSLWFEPMTNGLEGRCLPVDKREKVARRGDKRGSKIGRGAVSPMSQRTPITEDVHCHLAYTFSQRSLCLRNSLVQRI